jgi:hypothetical protein
VVAVTIPVPSELSEERFEFRNMATVVSVGILFGQKKSENTISSIRTSSTRAGGAIKDSGLLAG